MIYIVKNGVLKMTGFTKENGDFKVDLISAYKELSESLALENEDKIANDYIQYCLKYDVKKTIEFDKKRRKMIVNFPDHSEEIPLGELLLSFLRCDFSTYELTRKLTKEMYNNPLGDFESAGFTTNLPPFFVSQLAKIGVTPQEHSKKCVIDKFVKFNIDVHPYFMFFRTNDVLTQDGNVLFDKKLDMLSLQKQLRDAFSFCLDADYDERLKDLSAMARYYIYSNNHLYYPNFQFASTFNITPSKVTDADMHIFRTQKDMTAEEILNCSDASEIVTPNKLSQEMIDYTKKQKIKMMECFEVCDVESIAYLEFFKMLEYNLMARKCHNCGRYFIFKGNYDNNYCDRKHIGNRTCQQIGADKDYAERVKNTPVWKAQKRAYKRMHARFKNSNLTEAQFDKWNKKSVFCRDFALEHPETEKAFIAWCDDKSTNFERIMEFDIKCNS